MTWGRRASRTGPADRAPPPARAAPDGRPAAVGLPLKLTWGPAETPRVRFCETCWCPATEARDDCAFCGAPLERTEPVSFSLERRDEGYAWVTSEALVASASLVEGLWRLADSRGAHVVTLVPLIDPGPGTDATALVAPGAHLVGSIRPHDAAGGRRGAVVNGPDGRAVLVLRTDGDHGAHVVDRTGDIVAIASWDDPDAATDVLVTALGTRHSLALVFGLLLTLEVSRHGGRTPRTLF